PLTSSRPAMRPRPSIAGSTARTFRRMLTRADLRERPDAKPGPPRREQVQAPDEQSEPPPPYDRENDIRLGPMLRSERRITIRSGELIVGLLARSTHGPETWSWALTGVERSRRCNAGCAAPPDLEG